MKPTGTPLDPRPPRRHKVERARELVRDPNYPPKEVLHSVAKILSRKLPVARSKSTD